MVVNKDAGKWGYRCMNCFARVTSDRDPGVVAMCGPCEGAWMRHMFRDVNRWPIMLPATLIVDEATRAVFRRKP